MSRTLCGTFYYRALMVLLGTGVGVSATAWSQHVAPYNRSTAIDQANSRAEQEAEQMVSLSADRILSILHQEPGLLLQVKKALVRRAFEQGRILDAKDLTDEALFRIIREDDNIRIIATREIEDRSYVRAKPTREELARNLPCRQPMPAPGEAANRPDQSSQETKRVPTQEEVYWLKHESDLDCYLTQYLPYGTAQTLYAPPQTAPASSELPYPLQQDSRPQSPQQPYPPSQVTPRGPPTDYRKQLQVTHTQLPQGSFEAESDQNEMAGLQPDDLSGVVNASQSNRYSASSRNEAGLNGAGPSGLALPPGGSSIGSLPGRQGQAPGTSQEALPENRSQLPLQPYLFPKTPQQPRLRHRVNPYADVPSLYDLYAQYSKRSPTLERFGEDIFRNGTGNLDELPMDLPAGPDYVVGPGDGLTINLSGGISQRLQRVVDREGRLVLPEVGAVEVSGRSWATCSVWCRLFFAASSAA
jgi:hypothetical protein